MDKFDTNVQRYKYLALKEVIKAYDNGTLDTAIYEVPKKAIQEDHQRIRCCVYKERAIFSERMELAMGRLADGKKVINVIDIACDDCPASGYTVTSSCRGCLAHRCHAACKKDAIYFEGNQAHIDKTKCINCGLCAKACQYSAIINLTRPCENACKLKAIKMGENHATQIDYDKCITCGACVYQCPFGAIVDRSYILDALDILKNSNNNKNYKVFAAVAPSISSQFLPYRVGQVFHALKKLGFYYVAEAALGADLVAYSEAEELVEKGFLTTSCCPSFVELIEKKYPSLVEHISSNLSPMGALGKYIKEQIPDCKVIFIGPCTSKKKEMQRETVSPYIDCVLTFEELNAFIDARGIDLSTLEEKHLQNASFFGRIFARSGGVRDAVKQALIEQGKDKEFEYNPVAANGIDECNMKLLLKSRGALPNNLIEGMACVSGCIGGPCALTHGPKDLSEVDRYGNESLKKTITEALSFDFTTVYDKNKK